MAHLDSKELMIGDLVINTEFDKNEIETIETIEPNRVWLTHSKTYVPIEYIKPVIITPEILVKNGFVLDDEWYIYTEQGVNIEVAFRDDNKFVYDLSILTGSGSMDIHAKYLHELQHAMRMFNINKTIEL